MGQGNRKFWLPLTLMGAVFAIIVCADQVVFYAVRPPAAAIPRDPDRNVDLVSRMKKRLARRLPQIFERWNDVPASVRPAGEDGPVAGPACPGPDGRTTSEEGPAVPARPAPKDPESPAPPCAAFSWPAPWIPESRPPLPDALRLREWSDFRAELVTDLSRRCAVDPVADLGDAMLGVPELILDRMVSFVGGLSARPPAGAREPEADRSVTERMLDIRIAPRQERLTTVFLQQWAESERKYLGDFEDSRTSTFGFQNRTEDADMEELALDQRKVLWDTLRRTVMARYKVHSPEQIQEEAWYIDRWSGLDYAVLPPFIGAYLYYRGLNRRIPLGDTELRVSLEPVSQLIRRNHDRPVAVALEWTLNGFPVGIIVSAGIYHGGYDMDFAGIGTSIGAARSAVQGEQETRPR